MIKIEIKPLSVNEAWKGRRYKTDSYKIYERSVLLSLKPIHIPEGNLSIYFEFGFSSKGSDIDNPVKTTMDCLQKKYGFNDSRVYEMNLKKVIVPKGKEYFKFNITKVTDS